MSREEILAKMLTKEPEMLFHTMPLGGSAAQLRRLEAEGAISSQARYSGRHRQRDWYLTPQQHAAASTAVNR